MKFWKRRVDAYEEVDYEPITVLDILREMKDLSELMTDLAYSALVLDSDPIGEEVESLARRMDWLKYQLRLTASLAVRTPEEAEQVSGILQIGDASEHIANAASDLIEILDANVQLRPFLGRVLDEADDRVGTVKVPDDAPLIGETPASIRLESEIGVRVLAIRRGAKWLYRPGKNAVFRAGDILLIRGQLEGSEHLRDWLHGKEAEL